MNVVNIFSKGQILFFFCQMPKKHKKVIKYSVCPNYFIFSPMFMKFGRYTGEHEMLGTARRYHVNILSSSCIYDKKYVILIFQHYCIAQCGHGEIRFAGTKLFLSQVIRSPRMLPRKGGSQIGVLYTHFRYSQK